MNRLFRFLSIPLVLLSMGFLGWSTVTRQYQRVVQIQRTDQPDVIMEVIDPSLDEFSSMWKNEIQRRFHHSVGILMHGGEFVSGQWISQGSIQPSLHVIQIQDVIHEMQHRYPDRTLVVLACNPGHLKLNVPGVWYASSLVWCVPDRALTSDMLLNHFDRLSLDMPFFQPSPFNPVPTQSRWQMNPDVVGNIFEFVQDN